MKIQEYGGDEIINVFAIYWYSNGKTSCYGLPRNHGALRAYDFSELEIIDPKLSGRYTFHSNSSFKGLFHHALVEESLFNDLLEYDKDAYKRFDENAYNRFLEIIKAEGLVSADFY